MDVLESAMGATPEWTNHTSRSSQLLRLQSNLDRRESTYQILTILGIGLSNLFNAQTVRSSISVTTGFSIEKFLATLKKHHKSNEEHPDYIASDPAFTNVSDCGCTLGQK
jgi:hypothetical protein